MILKKSSENFRQNRRFFDDSAVFKGLKSHDAGTGGTKVWYQNVRKAVSYNSMSKVRLGGLGQNLKASFTKNSSLKTPPGEEKS